MAVKNAYAPDLMFLLSAEGSLFLEWICKAGLEVFGSLRRVKDLAERGRMLK